MNRVIKRIITSTLLLFLITISGLITITLFPQPLFANKLEHGQFTVYANESIDEHMEIVLDNAMDLIKRSELYDSEYTYDIFLSYHSFYNRIDNAVFGEGVSAKAIDNNVIIKVDIDAKENLFYPTFRNACESNLTYLLAHEMIHCLQEHRYGKWKFNPFRPPEYWKLEGYPEYISRQKKLSANGYSLSREIDRYVDLENKATDVWLVIEEGRCQVPQYYYKGRLMIEYLMDIKGQSYDRILNDTISAEHVYREMIYWNDECKIMNFENIR